jgi:hypothetical protein
MGKVSLLLAGRKLLLLPEEWCCAELPKEDLGKKDDNLEVVVEAAMQATDDDFLATPQQ